MASEITPNEALIMMHDKLQLHAVRRTVLNYEKDNLMPRAWRSENGRETYYTLEALAEFYASWKLLHGDFISALPGFSADDKLRLTPKFVSYVRHVAYEVESFGVDKNGYGSTLDALEMLGVGIDEFDSNASYTSNLPLLFGFSLTWRDYKKEALLMLKE